MDSEKILIVGKPLDSVLSQSLERRGWSFQYADNLKQAIELSHSELSCVGLFHLSQQGSYTSAEVESLTEGSHCQWVALVDRLLLERIPTRQLISQCFSAYYPLPIELDQLDFLLGHAQRMASLQNTLVTSDEEPPQNDHDEYEMVGTTPIMHRLFKTIRKVAAVDAPVFISGESGTGKELTARAIHERSQRAAGPFSAVNCGSLPSNLIQSELFGHEKGAFTGASQRKVGRIEATSGGTLFLDEIGDLPLEMQVNLLRFLEDHRIQRVGGLEEIAVDIRVLAATHIDLEKAVVEGKFREDLYHRLNVLQVIVPPLRERQEDIELLAKFFFEKFHNEKPLQVRGFSQEALTVMKRYSWPGNIRELINRVRRAMVMCENRLIRPDDLGLERRYGSRSIITLEQARDVAEREVIRAALGRNNFKIQNAAKDLAVSRVTLYRLIEKHQLMRSPASSEQTIPSLQRDTPANSSVQ